MLNITSCQTNLQSKTVAQLRDFVGKLGGLQSEHQALRLRKHSNDPPLLSSYDRTRYWLI